MRRKGTPSLAGALKRRYLEFVQLADTTTLRILEFFYTQSNVRVLYDAVRKLNMPSTSFWRRISTLKRKGITFTIDVDEKKIGLSKVGFFLYDTFLEKHEIPHSHWYNVYTVSSVPFGTYLVYYYPIMYGYKFIRDEISKICKQEKTDYLMINCAHIFSARPNFIKYFDVEKGRFNYLWKDWINKIKEIFEADSPQVTNRYPIFIVKHEEKPEDWIDILILKELEGDAFKSFKEISERIGIRTWKVKYHYDKHILAKGIIRGIRPKLIYTDITNAYTCISVLRNEGIDEYKLKKLIDFLIELPFIFAAVLSSDLKTLALQIAVPYDELVGFFYFKKTLKQYFDVVLEFNYHYQHFSRRTIPYTNYNPYTGVWVKYPSEVASFLQEKLAKGQESTAVR